MDDVHLAPYDPAWPARFAAEAARLRSALPPAIVGAIEHFGSTAIPGMPAKPIIDILIATPDLAAARCRMPPILEPLGYAFWAGNPRSDRLFFVKGLPPTSPHRTHHVHVTETGGELWTRLRFRDHLVAHPEEAARYAALKRSLATRYRTDREAYTEAKSAYVAAVMQRLAP